MAAHLRGERELRNVNGGDSPGLTTVAGGHVTSHAVTLGQCVDVVRVSDIEDDLGIDPGYTKGLVWFSCKIGQLTVSANRAAVVFGALDSATPALSLAITGG